MSLGSTGCVLPRLVFVVVSTSIPLVPKLVLSGFVTCVAVKDVSHQRVVGVWISVGSFVVVVLTVLQIFMLTLATFEQGSFGTDGNILSFHLGTRYTSTVCLTRNSTHMRSSHPHSLVLAERLVDGTPACLLVFVARTEATSNATKAGEVRGTSKHS